MVVIGAQDNQTRVDAALEHLREIVGKRKPCRTVARLHIHAHAQLGHHVVGRNALVAGAHTRSDVCVEAAIGLGDGVVARHALAGLEGLPHLMLGILLTSQDAGEVHHLAQAHNVIPLHGLGNLCRIHVRAAVVKAGHGGHARRRGEHRFERGALGVVKHHAHAIEAYNVAAFVWIGKNRSGAARNHNLGVLGTADHSRLDMNVRIDIARSHVLARSVHYRRVLTNAMLRGVLAYAQIGDAPTGHGDIGVFQNLVCGYAHQVGMTNHEVCRLLALCHAHELVIALPKRSLAKMVDHVDVLSSFSRDGLLFTLPVVEP